MTPILAGLHAASGAIKVLAASADLGETGAAGVREALDAIEEAKRRARHLIDMAQDPEYHLGECGVNRVFTRDWKPKLPDPCSCRWAAVLAEGPMPAEPAPRLAAPTYGEDMETPDGWGKSGGIGPGPSADPS